MNSLNLLFTNNKPKAVWESLNYGQALSLWNQPLDSWWVILNFRNGNLVNEVVGKQTLLMSIESYSYRSEPNFWSSVHDAEKWFWLWILKSCKNLILIFLISVKDNYFSLWYKLLFYTQGRWFPKWGVGTSEDPWPGFRVISKMRNCLMPLQCQKSTCALGQI